MLRNGRSVSDNVCFRGSSNLIPKDLSDIKGITVSCGILDFDRNIESDE